MPSLCDTYNEFKETISASNKRFVTDDKELMK